MIAFGKADRLVDAFAGGQSCLCDTSESGSESSPESDPIEICGEGQESSSQALGFSGAYDGLVRIATSFYGPGFEHDVVPESPCLDQIEPPLI